jgi:hypothetical protein
MYNTKGEAPKQRNPLKAINIPMSIYRCYILDSNLKFSRFQKAKKERK